MKLSVVTKTETETEAAFMMFNVVESGKAQKKTLPILGFLLSTPV